MTNTQRFDYLILYVLFSMPATADAAKLMYASSPPIVMEFLGEILIRIQGELETRDLSEILTEKNCLRCTLLPLRSGRTLLELTFRNDDEVKIAKNRRLPSDDEVLLSNIR